VARKQDWTRRARTVAQIKQLCCLGLGPEAIAPPLTRLLPRLIPGLSVTLFFTDANGELVNMYDPNPAAAEAAPLYVSEFYKQRRESDVTMAIADAFRLHPICTRLGQILKVDQRTWGRSDLYNLILRPMDYHDAIQLAVRDRGRPVGVVKISRGVGAPEFTARELDLLAALEPYLAHAFAGSPGAMPLIESDAEEDQGLIIADRNGRVRHLSPQARALLIYATCDEIAPGKARARGKLELPPPVAQLARTLAQVFDGQVPATPPVHHHKNGWGEFVFRAYWLEGQGAEPPLVGIRVSRREPLPVRLLRRMEHLPLSQRQIEVSLHLVSGETYAAIAERLGVTRPTVIYHAQEVFNKLAVASRAELQAKLMTL
jgi:DNA-binding CsgD family transcriptional regulator